MHIDLDNEVPAMEMGEAVAEMTGEHQDTATVLNVALEYTRKHEKMAATTRLLEELVAGKLDQTQIDDIKKWDKKLDTAI